MPDKSRIYKKISIAFIIAYFLSFLVFYLPNYAITIPDSAVEGYLIAREIFRNILEFAIPATAAAAVLMLDGEERIYKRAISALRLSATSAIYYIPYSYLYCLSLGFDSAESILFALPMALADIVIGVAVCLVLAFVGSFFALRGQNGEGGVLLKNSTMTDLSDPMTRGIFAICIGRMAIMLVLEIIDTVTFLIEESGLYGGDEILYIMLTYVLILAYTIGTHAVIVKFKNKIIVKEEN